MGEFLEIAKVMVQPAMKLLEMCGNAIGTVYEPRHMRKITDAEVYKIKQLGNAISETDSLPITYDNGEISMNTLNLEDFAKRAELRANYQLLREQNNIESVVGKAYQELLDAPEVPSDPVDEDWTTRFFNIVKEINTEEMQYIWSKILAGEIINPGSFSMRTLETIRNMSQHEATIFQRILPILLASDNDWFVLSEPDMHNKCSVTYDDILTLDECGLMISNGTMSITMNVSEGSAIVHNKTYCIMPVEKKEQKREFTFGIYSLTRAGKELLEILSYEPSETYICEVAEFLFRENPEVNLEVRKVQKIEDNIVCTTGEIIKEYH